MLYYIKSNNIIYTHTHMYLHHLFETAKTAASKGKSGLRGTMSPFQVG